MHRSLCFIVIVACNGGTVVDSDEDAGDDDDGCTVTAPDDLYDPVSELAGIDHFCEDQPAYMPDLPQATVWYIGDIVIDDCGELSGTEIAYLYPNPKWVELDGYECIVTWTLTGVVRAPFSVGDYAVDLEAIVDPAHTTCPTDAYDMSFYSGEEFMALKYDIVQTGDGSITLFFGEGSRAEVARGEDNANHIAYRTSTVHCAIF